MSSFNVHFLTYHINKDLMMAQRLFPLFLPLTSLCPIPKLYTIGGFFYNRCRTLQMNNICTGRKLFNYLHKYIYTQRIKFFCETLMGIYFKKWKDNGCFQKIFNSFHCTLKFVNFE